MRILHLDSGGEMRGGQWQALALHRTLVRMGHESLLLAREQGPLFRAAEREGLPVEMIDALSVARLSRHYHVVHAHDSRSHTTGAVCVQTPLVVSRRVAFPVKRSPLSRWKYARAKRFLAVSEFVAGELVAAGVSRERIDVVYDGVAVPEQKAQGDAILVPETADPAKGMAIGLEAAKLAGGEVIVSRDLPADLPRARVIVYMTQSEGLGSGILLAMAHGVPAVASKVGGIPEIVREGVTGFLVANEARAAAEAVGRIRPEMGDAARQAVIDRFNEERMVADTLKAYARACA